MFKNKMRFNCEDRKLDVKIITNAFTENLPNKNHSSCLKTFLGARLKIVCFFGTLKTLLSTCAQCLWFGCHLFDVFQLYLVLNLLVFFEILSSGIKNYTIKTKASLELNPSTVITLIIPA